MSDKPILFSAPMIRALLAGTKTQTRRVAGVPKIERDGYGVYAVHGRGGGVIGVPDDKIEETAADYLPIQPGDRLYVREAWRPGYNAEGWREDLGRVAKPSDFDPATTAIEYLADGTRELGGDNRPGIHMPRWASRLTLHVTAARVQRLQDISEEDARAEGVDEATCYAQVPSLNPEHAINPPISGPYWALGYMRLWNTINGADSWSDNPWVAAYTFDVERCNIAEARQP